MTGNKTWAILGGHIPLHSNGEEPQHTSTDVLSILNMNDVEAHITITIYYADREPAGPYKITVSGKRSRNIRFNDLIDPEPVPLDTDFSAFISSDVPVVVGFMKINIGTEITTTTATNALPINWAEHD